MSAALLEAIRPHLREMRSAPDGRLICWCPFHADGEGAPPHTPNLYVSERGFICHACGEKGSLRGLAEHLGVELPPREERLDAVYDYLDEKGALLFQVVRKPGKRFRQRQTDGQGQWLWNLKGVRRVLYLLPDLLARPDEPVYVVEGEKDADRLAALGLVATTNSGGAGKWRTEYSHTLEGRDVVILPDNDEPGRKHGDTVATSLRGVARSIKVVELPGLPAKGDVSDWLNSGHTREELLQRVAEGAGWTPPEGEEPDTSESDDNRERDSVAKQLVSLFLASGAELFRDERGEPYARIETQEGKRILPVGSKQLRLKLFHLAWAEMDKALTGEVVRTAANILDSIARFEAPQHTLHVRSAWHDGAIWIDLDGLRAIRVRPGGWEIVNEPPILFRSFPHQEPFSLPEHGGDLSQIFRFVNLPHDDTRVLFPGYLVSAMVPGIPVPPLVLTGPQGAAKTTTLRVAKRSLDPSRVEVRGGVKDLSEYALAAAQNRVLFFDNLTHLPDWLSDAFCRAVTGDGFTKRTLYTDEDQTVLEFRCVIGFSGINQVATRADLLDRSLILELEHIPESERKEERRFWEEFEAARPCIFGGLLDALAGAMETFPALDPGPLPRMADAAKWGAAATVALGLSAADFLGAFKRNIDRQTEAAVDGSLVAQVTLALMKGRDTWSGTASDLLDRLKRVATETQVDQRVREWPKAPNSLSRRLNEARPALLRRGIQVDHGKSGDRIITLLRMAGSAAQSAQIAQEPQDDSLAPDPADDTTDDTVGPIVPRIAVVRSLWGPEGDMGDAGGVAGTRTRRLH